MTPAVPRVQRDRPTGISERFNSALVADAIGSDFLKPKICSGLWNRRLPAALMAVPEATMDEQAFSAPGQGNVGRTWQVSAMKAESVSEAMK
jgi:hypothetical protein